MGARGLVDQAPLQVLGRPPSVREPSDFELEGLEALAGPRAIAQLRRLGGQLHRAVHRGRARATVWHVNSATAGGGVADILNSLVSLSNALGVPTQWLVIGGDPRFFEITKSFHNALQGDDRVVITEASVAHYSCVSQLNARRLAELAAERGWPAPDIVVLHDPQPLGLVADWRTRFPRTSFIWQGHLQFDLQDRPTGHPGSRVWEVLARYVHQCDAAVFHLPEQVPPGIGVPVRCFLPSINPFGYLNRDLASAAGAPFVAATLAKYGMEPLTDRAVPVIAQVGRFDPWKDTAGVLQAYREALACLPNGDRPPHLVLVGPLADDDPEAARVLAELRAALTGSPDPVHLVPLDPGEAAPTPQQAEALRGLGLDPAALRPADLIDLEINAVQTRADILVAKSIREGFGLAVTGAGFHGKARIVSEVGGLRAQVLDERGRAHACLVGGTPFDRETSIRMTQAALVRLLRSPERRATLGARARRHVLGAFLPHRHLADYYRLFLDVVGGASSHTRSPAPAAHARG